MPDNDIDVTRAQMIRLACDADARHLDFVADATADLSVDELQRWYATAEIHAGWAAIKASLATAARRWSDAWAGVERSLTNAAKPATQADFALADDDITAGWTNRLHAALDDQQSPAPDTAPAWAALRADVTP